MFPSYHVSSHKTLTSLFICDLVDVQNKFLHSQLRVARVELLDMLCMKLNMPKTRAAYFQLQCLRWTFGQKLVMSNGIAYWATDTGSTPGGSGSGCLRRDVFLLSGTEKVTTRLPNGDDTTLDTALCCEAIVFIKIDGLRELVETTGHQLPEHLQDELVENSLTFVLGRWLTAHPTSFERDSLCRPICPGPLQYNHCLWRYATSSRPRKLMVNNDSLPSRAFQTSGNMFGSTNSKRHQKWNEEKCLLLFSYTRKYPDNSTYIQTI